MSKFAITRPAVPVHRLGRVPDPWVWPDWSPAHADGTFGNRWECPYDSRRIWRPLRILARITGETTPPHADTRESGNACPCECEQVGRVDSASDRDRPHRSGYER